ncbi:MAG: alpha-L-fucosidase [Verrucomicrobia bacterium]|nr:alpha-L-fucosidase [Verrucomicrobiota bacterium]
MRIRQTVLGLAVVFGYLTGSPCGYAQEDLGTGKETPAQRDARMQWWREAKFGMFIHWNTSCVPGGVYHGKHNYFVGEWLMHDEKVSVAEYRSYAKQFNPVKFNAEQMVLLAKEAGMRYVVFTAKHHDGLAMYASKVSPWNIVEATPFKRDVVKELADACQKHGLRFGLYYSHAMDWNNPGAAVPGGIWDKAQAGEMDEYLRKVSIPQLEEILSRYGKISVLWFDTSYDMDRRRADMVRAVLKLQPGIIINDRLGGDYPGDAASPEGSIPADGMPGRDFETCMSINDTWGFKITDQNWKPRKVLLEQLVDLASKGGNYLLNVGPNPEGEIPAPAVKRLKQVGEWTKLNGEAIFGTSASPFKKQLPWGRCTKKVDAAGATLFFHVFQWPTDGKLAVPGLKNQVETAYLLADPAKKPLQTAADAAGATIHLPAAAPDKDISLVVVRVKGQVDIADQP